MNNQYETHRNLIRNLTKETNLTFTLDIEDEIKPDNISQTMQHQFYNEPKWHLYSIDSLTLSETCPSRSKTASHQANLINSTVDGLNYYSSLSGSCLSKLPLLHANPVERMDTVSGLTQQFHPTTCHSTITDNAQQHFSTPPLENNNRKNQNKINFESIHPVEKQIERIVSAITQPNPQLHCYHYTIIETPPLDNTIGSISTPISSRQSCQINSPPPTTATQSSSSSTVASSLIVDINPNTTKQIAEQLTMQQQQYFQLSQNNQPPLPQSTSSTQQVIAHNNTTVNSSGNNSTGGLLQQLDHNNSMLSFTGNNLETLTQQDGKNTTNMTNTSISSLLGASSSNSSTSITNNNNTINSSHHHHHNSPHNLISLNNNNNTTTNTTGGATATANSASTLVSSANNNSLSSLMRQMPTTSSIQLGGVGTCLGGSQSSSLLNITNTSSAGNSSMGNGGDHNSFDSLISQVMNSNANSSNNQSDSNRSSSSYTNMMIGNSNVVSSHLDDVERALEGLDFQQIMDLTGESFPSQFNQVDLESSSVHQHAMMPSHVPHELLDHMLLHHTNNAFEQHHDDQQQQESNSSASINQDQESQTQKNVYTPLTFTVEQLRPHFETPIKNVAAMLNISLTQLKRVCRTVGIPRWPYRKIQSLKSKINEKNILLEKLIKQSKLIIDPLKRQNIENRMLNMKNDIANVEKQIQQIKLDPKCAVSGNFDNSSDTMLESDGSESSNLTFHNQVITNAHLKNGNGAIMGQMRSVVHVGKAPQRRSGANNANKSNIPVATINNGVQMPNQDSNAGKRKTRSIEHVTINNNNGMYQNATDVNQSNMQPMMNNQFTNAIQSSNVNIGNFVQVTNLEVERKKRKMNGEISPPAQNIQNLYQNQNTGNNQFMSSPVNNQNFQFNNYSNNNSTSQPFYFNNGVASNNGDNSSNNFNNPNTNYNLLQAIITRNIPHYYNQNQQQNTYTMNTVSQPNNNNSNNAYFQNYYTQPMVNNAPMYQNNSFMQPNSSLSSSDNNNADTLDTKALFSQNDIYTTLGTKFQ